MKQPFDEMSKEVKVLLFKGKNVTRLFIVSIS
jgi:hypothetical protein